MIMKHFIICKKKNYENINKKFTFEQDEVTGFHKLDWLLIMKVKVICGRFRVIMGHFRIFEKSTHENSNEKFEVEQKEVNSSQVLE